MITTARLASQNRTTGSNSSSGGAIGVSVGVGSGKAGVSVFANANRANGKENGDTDSYTETNLTAGQSLTLNSGRDTTFSCAQASWLSSISSIIAIGNLR